MRLELAERLRCPRGHAATPLVVMAQRVDERTLLAGIAGCPVCHVEARLTAGAVLFGEGDGDSDGSVRIVEAGSDGTPLDPDRLTRTMALLGLAEPGGTLLLSGRYAAMAGALTMASEAGAVIAEGAVPFTDHTFRAAALESPTDDAVRTVAIGGRVLAPAGARMPAGLRELARDEQEWVAEREVVSAPVRLARAP